ncbi:MAG: nuclease-related domain-containing protein [Anaerolineales bacterium]
MVGPPGVWVLEVKNLHGDYRNIGETWEYRQGGKWKTAFANPSSQAKDNATRLGNFLRADHLDTWVNPAVVWVNEESPLFVENPSTSVWLFNHLPDELGNIWQSEKLSQEERNKITYKLNKLCETQKKAG